MSIHAFFECLAVGLQKTPLGILGLASAILVHKWAEGLTLGLIYRKENYRKSIRTAMILIQALVNVAGLIVGTIIIDQGNFVMAFFMSISAGTFLYISLVEVLSEQINDMNKKKAVAMLSANVFLTLLVLLEKTQEQLASDE
jgi:zinc transporter 1/2/3